ncbi:MAG: FkbM family methyltransferase [Alphaproteobacteria bacterium]|nr:FkbM family methyltransferase [Alphaproteobacteria bacterium]
MNAKSKTTTIPLESGAKKIELHCFDNPASRSIARGIVSGETYPPVDFLTKIRTVVDVGANIGSAALYFGLRYPKARVVALEPGGEAFELLARNARQLPNVDAFNIGLYSEDRTARLYSGAVDSVTASVGDSVLNTRHSETINLRRASDWMGENDIDTIDILKIDTEGCEVPILRSLEAWLPRVKVLYVEYHSEDDRLAIDTIMRRTHLLFAGTIAAVHRGEFTYVAERAFPSRRDRDRQRITVDLA